MHSIKFISFSEILYNLDILKAFISNHIIKYKSKNKLIKTNFYYICQKFDVFLIICLGNQGIFIYLQCILS